MRIKVWLENGSMKYDGDSASKAGIIAVTRKAIGQYELILLGDCQVDDIKAIYSRDYDVHIDRLGLACGNTVCHVRMAGQTAPVGIGVFADSCFELYWRPGEWAFPSSTTHGDKPATITDATILAVAELLRTSPERARRLGLLPSEDAMAACAWLQQCGESAESMKTIIEEIDQGRADQPQMAGKRRYLALRVAVARSKRADELPIGAILYPQAKRLREGIEDASKRLKVARAFPDDARIVAVELEELLK